MEMDHEVDVFHAVKLIRLNRPQLIDGPRTRFVSFFLNKNKIIFNFKRLEMQKMNINICMI